jgi:hypothetical protein
VLYIDDLDRCPPIREVMTGHHSVDLDGTLQTSAL